MNAPSLLAALGLALLAAGPLRAAAASAGAVDDARLQAAAAHPQDWITYGGTWSEQRYSALTQINERTVGRLRPAWSFELDTTRGQEATPLEVDGVLYVSTAWSKVYALDARTGRQIWFFDPKVPGAAAVPICCDVNNRGVAVYQGKVFVGTLDGRLIALDAASGKPLWSVATFAPEQGYSMTGAPRAARGKVFIGNAGADFGGRGFVSAYDAASGRLVWRFYTVPSASGAPDGAASDAALARLARPSWIGALPHAGGGNAWNALVYDPDFNCLYFGTGNAYPWNPTFRARSGDNLFTASLVAVDADTGAYRWHYQETPGDAWDFDSVADITLVDLPLEGRAHKLLLHAPKNGFFYVIDRATGKLLSATAYVPGINWARGIDPQTGRPEVAPQAHYKDAPWTGSPGGGGAHNWNPVAYSPQTRLIYIPAQQNYTRYRPTRRFEFIEPVGNLGVDLFGAQHGAEAREAPPRGKSYLLAWDPIARHAAWQVEGGGGGVLATAGGLVLQGRSRDGLLGSLAAFRASNGAPLWSWNVPDAILGGPSTYSIGGEQYVTVATGAGLMSFGAQPRARHPGHVIAFKLDGNATLPPDPPAPPPANPPARVAPAAAVRAGETLYGSYCSRCHGVETASANVLPDLRRAAMLTEPDAWQSIVIGGLFADQGMASWRRFLSPADAEAIRQYVGEQARALRRREAAAAPTP
ncbi:MAG TPA: PQQ-dependent dehydrogenase, methanol/ethanol family [Steroidobacteraceae bacterium]|nr:PQQ-dependent dehydrogenase, methanol/ethanol family [Steroidobacteraceae bacterium]